MMDKGQKSNRVEKKNHHEQVIFRQVISDFYCVSARSSSVSSKLVDLDSERIRSAVEKQRFQDKDLMSCAGVCF